MRFIWQLFLDDNIKNVTAGKALGLRTVLVILLGFFFFFFWEQIFDFFLKENHFNFYLYLWRWGRLWTSVKRIMN